MTERTIGAQDPRSIHHRDHRRADERSNRLKFTPDGKLVLISDLDGGDLVVLDAATHKTIKRLKLGTMPEGILIPPDGARA